MAGVMTSQRTQGRPRAVKNILGDKVTAMTAAISILAALNEAQRSGKGQHLRIAMIDAVAYYLMPDTASRHTYLPHDAGIAPSMNTLEPFQTADGFITIAPLTDSIGPRFSKRSGIRNGSRATSRGPIECGDRSRA